MAIALRSVLVLLALLAAACGSSNITNASDAPVNGDGPGLHIDAPGSSAIDGPVCVGAGETCAPGEACCTGTCDSGRCSTSSCVVIGDSCVHGGDCCTGNCNSSGVCAAIPGATCTTEGNACGGDLECCSQTCTNGRCVTASGPLGCHATGDICYQGSDCCSTLCNATGGAPGICQQLGTFGSGGCMLDGEPCSGGTTCCSRVCAATPGGGNACQLAAGCRITGDVCHQDSDCCGAAGSMAIGAGSVTCNIISGTDPPIGSCANPNGNQPEGNVCGENVNARHDCEGCMSPKIQCCKLDSLGIPRCYGGSTSDCPTGYDGTEGCCIAAGAVCTFSSECCGGVPCLPDSSGVLHCSNVTCVPADGACTATGDCCTGLECEVPAGQPTGVCKQPTVGDGGVCALGGQMCDDSVACCTGYNCDLPTGEHCTAGADNCTCLKIIP